MKQIILGTAGHIDHGKTTLVKALTGIDTDRLKEEKARGITIELGFAHLELPGGQMLGIVDVPGHEKFVKNMVAGATGIDLVALVIAADEGVMPQTREHLEICQLLRVRSGLVILTKVDLVDSDWLELVKEDVSNFLSGTFLAGAPVIEVSSTTGRGIDELLKTLDLLVKGVAERDTGSFFRLPIDRVFTMKGFGTVVTGTTISGQIDLGEEATIYPKDVTSKIRGIQVHNREVTRVSAGLRTAINLQGVEKAEIERGDVLAAKDSLRATQLADVTLDLLKSAPRKLKHRAKVRFHTGTSEIISTILLLDRDELNPGETCFAQIRLEKPTLLLARDRYVIRSYSPVRAIGGGEVLNALPERRKRRAEKSLSELKTLSRGDLNEITEQFVHTGRFRGMEQSALPFLTNTSRKRLDEVLKKLLAQKKVILYDREKGGLIHSEYLQAARDEITSTLERYHRENPLREGFHKEELRSRTAGLRNPKLFQFLISQLTNEGVVVQEKETLRLGSHKVTLAADQQQVRRRIEEIYLKGGLQPPYFKEIKDEFAGGGPDVLQVMLKEGVLIKVKEDLFFHRDVLAELRSRLIEHLREKGEIDTPQFKEMTNVSRKYTIPLLEYFDISQVTVRVGDKRVLRKK
ncbi:MAG: selenocysteine-specific translation elongation factor [Deltaproteobacteria bacterium HGW-Deltaproteobacteria-21]|nr:MAG: selenocysteine-specific translation elongation factor [Deltaproteobacteria bacterium HGW-Deltaproteobacteria-21]